MRVGEKPQKWLESIWSNTAASMFDINLKTKYAPFDVNEDYLIETILVRSIRFWKITRIKSSQTVDYDNLTDSWESRAEKLRNNFHWYVPPC
jgi:hypothetical protein